MFVNGRCVNYPKWLIHAINQASKETIPVGKYVGLIMFLKTNPSDIDINVHPTKREIKFVNENQMYELFYKFIKTSLESDAPSNIINIQNDSNNFKTNNFRKEINFKSKSLHLLIFFNLFQSSKSMIESIS